MLVGDHFQLSPLVRNDEAVRGGMAESLFKTLSEKHPSSVIELRSQYRMTSDIMNLSNTLIYNNRLICGNSKVASSSLMPANPKVFTRVIGILPENIVLKILEKR